MSDILHNLDRGYMLLWREGRPEDAFAGIDDDFEWVVPDHPEGAVRHGQAGVMEFIREWVEPWAELDVDWELHEAGPDRVLAIIDMRGRGRESGVTAEMHFGQLWTFDGPRATRMVMYYDADDARRAAGLA
jgi:ketosteroid isomerase-like protein